MHRLCCPMNLPFFTDSHMIPPHFVRRLSIVKSPVAPGRQLFLTITQRGFEECEGEEGAGHHNGNHPLPLTSAGAINARSSLSSGECLRMVMSLVCVTCAFVLCLFVECCLVVHERVHHPLFSSNPFFSPRSRLLTVDRTTCPHSSTTTCNVICVVLSFFGAVFSVIFAFSCGCF
jgi:hypothetical protein